MTESEFDNFCSELYPQNPEALITVWNKLSEIYAEIYDIRYHGDLSDVEDYDNYCKTFNSIIEEESSDNPIELAGAFLRLYHAIYGC